MEYILSAKDGDCVLCLDEVPPEQDEEKRVLHRGSHCYVILNIYPYNSGHLMVAPYRHVGSLAELTDAETSELAFLVRQCERVLRNACRPDGFNIGINLGESAGAGVIGHVHAHIVPRWNGDTNYMGVCADTRVVPEAMEETFRRLKPYFSESPPGPGGGSCREPSQPE
jgi:ATP adenylyltransferase